MVYLFDMQKIDLFFQAIYYLQFQIMKNNELYRVCIKSGTLQQIPTFRVKIGKAQKKINPYFIPSDKQRYNCDSILQRYNNQQFLTLSVFYAYKFIGSGSIHFEKPEMPNQKVQIFNRDKQSIAFIDCSLVRIKKVVQVPALDISVQFLKFDDIGPKDMTGSPFIVLKYGELNYQTQKQPLYTQDQQYIFNESFKFPQSEMQRIIVQYWCEVNQQNKFLGVSLVYLYQKQFTNREMEFDINYMSKKRGIIKIGVFQDKKKQGKKKDYSNAPKRTLKATVVEAIMLNPIKKGTYIVMKVGIQLFETTTLFVQKKQISWNQSFTMQVNSEKQQLQVFMYVKQEQQKMMGRAFLQVSKIANRIYQLTFLDEKQTDIGKIYIQFYDHQLYSKERKTISKELAEKINNDLLSIKKRYEKPLHQYLQQLNIVLQQGILDISKKKPKNPLKDLGQYLISYRKNSDKKS